MDSGWQGFVNLNIFIHGMVPAIVKLIKTFFSPNVRRVLKKDAREFIFIGQLFDDYCS